MQDSLNNPKVLPTILPSQPISNSSSADSQAIPLPVQPPSKYPLLVLAPKKIISEDVISKTVYDSQAKDAILFKGVDILVTSKPGMGILLNDLKSHYVESTQKRELDEKLHILSELFQRFLSYEDFRLRIISNRYFYQVLKFRPVKEPELIREESPFVPYTKTGAGESTVLLYKMIRTDPPIVRSILEANGLHYTDNHNWNILWTSNHTKTYQYEGLNEYQKINHFPCSYEITRKDKLCDNIVQRQQKYGKSAFQIIPDTYILPDEFADFYNHYHEIKKAGGNNVWIIKPNALSRGRGIHLIDNTNDVPIDEPCVISKYIDNPLLINGYKFDIRIYVLLTSIDPLRIYVYNEGLARFCTEKYDIGEKDNRFSHLTNYSVNKRNEKFIQNKRADMDDVGQKWSISAMNKYLDKHGIDTSFLWAKIYDAIIRSFIATEPSLYTWYKKVVAYRGNCFELFGFDVLVDSDLRPWIMEVNLSPSLACESPLDFQIKSNLIADVLTLVGLRQFDRRKDGAFRGRPPMPQTTGKRRSLKGRSIDKFTEDDFKTSTSYKKLQAIPPKYRDILTEILEENERRKNFIRIYPSKGSDVYDDLFEPTRTNHKLIYKYLFGPETLLEPTESELMDLSLLKEKRNIGKNIQKFPGPYATPSKELPSIEKFPEPSLHQKITDMDPQDKILITGDDILIEYVSRLAQTLKQLKESELKFLWQKSIDQFVSHEVWRSSDSNSIFKFSEKLKLWQKVESRVNEMKERRKQMMKQTAIYRGNPDFEALFLADILRKQVIIQTFSVSQLEEMLRSSAKNVAHEVVRCLIPPVTTGILFNLMAWMSTAKSQSRGKIEDDSENNTIGSMGGHTIMEDGDKNKGNNERRKVSTIAPLSPTHAAVKKAKQLTPLRNGSGGQLQRKIQQHFEEEEKKIMKGREETKKGEEIIKTVGFSRIGKTLAEMKKVQIGAENNSESFQEA